MTGTVIFDPLIPWPVLAIVATVAVAGVVLALWRGLSGWALRGLAALIVIAALAGPVYQVEDRAPLTDIVLMIEDESASQTLSDRADQTAQIHISADHVLHNHPAFSGQISCCLHFFFIVCEPLGAVRIESPLDVLFPGLHVFDRVIEVLGHETGRLFFEDQHMSSGNVLYNRVLSALLDEFAVKSGLKRCFAPA